MCSLASPARALLFAAALATVAGGTRPARAQGGGPPASERVLSLGLDSLDAGLRVHHSQGYEDRARAVGAMVADSEAFYRDSLGVETGIRVALLDSADHARAGLEWPYGLPHFREGMAFLPADATSGAVFDANLPFGRTASAEVHAELERIGLTYEEAVPVMVDLIGLHEIGHAQIRAAGIDTKQRWFNEFLATYFAYAYLCAQDPDKAVVWDAVTRAGREGYEPAHTSLDDFNRLYIGVGVDNYGWYQNLFAGRVGEVYDAHGLDFLRRVRARLSGPMTEPEAAADLVLILEEIAPGFGVWSQGLDP